MTRCKLVGGLFLLSGLTGLVHEIVWIRLFALGFGNTAQALSTVLSVYLVGLALGAFGAAKFKGADGSHFLRFYGLAEVLISGYACAIPRLIQSTQPVLRLFYGTGRGAQIEVLLARMFFAAAILAPAALLMGATLPFLAEWISSTNREDAGQKIGFLYTLNLAGASAGALLSGFALLPALGFMRTLLLACALNAASGLAAIFLARKPAPGRAEPIHVKKDRAADLPPEFLPSGLWIASAFVSGLTCMLYEVAWSRVFGLLFGPTASTLTLILAAFLIGLTVGAMTASWLKRDFTELIGATQFGSIALLLCSIIAASDLPQAVARWVQSHSFDAAQIEWMKTVLLTTILLPLTIVIGLTFPLLLRIAPQREIGWAQRIGGAYGINTTGCILGSFLTGWVLIPWVGTETTLLLGATLNAGLGLALLHRVKPPWIKLGCVITAVIAAPAAVGIPRWDMIALTAGGYKYAPYYDSPAAIPQALDKAELVFLHEGISGTVAVRKEAGSLLLSIDGKVDASDSGGDLLTEKLLAHIPLMLNANTHRVCLIGFASGVTAGAILAHPVDSLDIVELSPDVVKASHLYDSVNLRPLDDRRTSLLVNDGRNHLELTSSRYDMIVSEPSNPWIAGMNSLFTRDFFRLARERLNPDGLFAQWFHIYNMPKEDLDSLLRSFSDVFPSAMLWQMNDGDVLLTGFAGDTPNFAGSALFSAHAIEDLWRVGVSDPSFLWNMYVMRDSDIGRFAAHAAPNTDDDPRLEFHGQRDLHSQTDIRNTEDLASFQRKLPPPPAALRVIDGMTEKRLVSYAGMFERAESRGRAFDNYRLAFQNARNGEGEEALAGMDRTARLPKERTAVAIALALPQSRPDTLESRTRLALEEARSGNTDHARLLFAEYADAHPWEPAARLNYGLFYLENKEYQSALTQFRSAISLNPAYLPALEATAETYLQMNDASNAILWSRRILEIDPNHSAAKQALNALQHEAK